MGWYFFSSVAILKQPLKFLARSEVHLAQTIWFLRHKQPGSNHHSGLKSKGKNKPVSCPQVPSGRGHWSRQWRKSESLGLNCRNKKGRLVRHQAVQNMTACCFTCTMRTLITAVLHFQQTSRTHVTYADTVQLFKRLAKTWQKFLTDRSVFQETEQAAASTTTVCFQC